MSDELDGVIEDAIREGWVIQSSHGGTTVLRKRTGTKAWEHFSWALATGLCLLLALNGVPLAWLGVIGFPILWVRSALETQTLTIYRDQVGEVVQVFK